MAVKIKRETPPSNIYDYSPPDSLQLRIKLHRTAVGNIYSADRSNKVDKTNEFNCKCTSWQPKFALQWWNECKSKGTKVVIHKRGGFCIDGWVLVGGFNPSTKTLTFMTASNSVTRFGLDAISYMRPNAIVNIDSSDLWAVYFISKS